MQKLTFHDKWDKSISPKDRKRIEEGFREANISENSQFEFTSLWEARNYKGELLVTVLVHNLSKQPAAFDHIKIRYTEEEHEKVAEHTFSIESLDIEPRTTMPWTFIFPFDSLEREPVFLNGRLNIVL
ncbi:SLAP domain-containing protein [Cytobacillus purgationiresistens]|uniref:SLAP domain-containing protein n=1 Tax=Cytobacillus purgationiresistens TaxID=863449 RepID=A0ABU0ARQ6_9BACI|nr:SLAP domain-containing protein [Cytobacillus purgationiresistens]MDQ0272735.1 SLAP domain-containing protein [Cytobacillus purgationiresistens]